MRMSIEESKRNLSYAIQWKDRPTDESMRLAIETMHKYQKIEELYDYWRSGKCEYTISCMENIGKVLRDGNDN